MNNLSIVEEEKNILIYDIEIEDGDFVGKQAQKSNGKYEKTLNLLQYNNHIIHVNNTKNFFKCFRCPLCDTFSYKTDHINRHFLCCKNRIKSIYAKNVYNLRESLNEKL